MATQNKNHHKKLDIKDQVLPYDPSECVQLIAYGYKKNKNHGIFTTIDAVDQIAAIVVEYLSDDEVITIKYKSGMQETHDGSDCRIMNFDCYTELFTTQSEIDDFIYDHLYPKPPCSRIL